MLDYDKHSYDVLVVGAGGAGLRAAITDGNVQRLWEIDADK